MNNETLNRLNAFVADYKKESEEKDAIIKQQNQTLLHISAELDAIKQHNPFDLVFITGSIENISNIIEGQTEPIIDEGCVGCCKVVDVAAKLQEELEDTENKLVGCRRLSNHRDRTIRELSAMVETKTKANQTIIHDKNTTIEELKDRNAEDLYELYVLDKKEIDWLRNVVSARDLSIKSLTCLATAKSNYEIILQNRRDRGDELEDNIKGLEAELSARKEDSAVLMKVVGMIRAWNRSPIEPRETINNVRNVVKDYLDAPEGPPETPIDEKVCVFCGCENPSVQVGSDWFCGMRCVHGQADVNKHLHNTDEPQEITVAFLELP